MFTNYGISHEYPTNIPSHKVVPRISHPIKLSHPIPVPYRYKDMGSGPYLPILYHGPIPSHVGYPVG